MESSGQPADADTSVASTVGGAVQSVGEGTGETLKTATGGVGDATSTS